jgi:hypothetical protein
MQMRRAIALGACLGGAAAFNVGPPALRSGAPAQAACAARARPRHVYAAGAARMAVPGMETGE